jgi:hypothetical protein
MAYKEELSKWLLFFIKWQLQLMVIIDIDPQLLLELKKKSLS